MLVIVDYGMGNSASIMNMVKRVHNPFNFQVLISSDVKAIEKARALILPGVGAFDHAMARLHDLGLSDVLRKRVGGDGVPFMGICLGMHVLFNSSEEGKISGLGLLPGTVKRFSGEPFLSGALKVPHMGWNQIRTVAQKSSFLEMEKNTRFYFVHSYHVVCDNPSHIVATCDYGYPFTCAVKSKNIFAVQFHPEKSHRFGMNIFKKFMAQSC